MDHCSYCGAKPWHPDPECEGCCWDAYGSALCRLAERCTTCKGSAFEPVRGWLVLAATCDVCQGMAKLQAAARARQSVLARVSTKHGCSPQGPGFKDYGGALGLCAQGAAAFAVVSRACADCTEIANRAGNTALSRIHRPSKPAQVH